MNGLSLQFTAANAELVSILVLLIYFAATVMIAILRKASRASFRCLTVILSAVAAFLVTLFLRDGVLAMFEQYGLPWLKSLYPNFAEYYDELMGMSEQTVTVVKELAISAVSPTVFLVLFLLFSVATWIVYFVITSLLFFIYHKKKRRPISAMIWGAVQSFVVVFVIMIPVCFYLGIAPEIMDTAAESGLLEEDTAEKIQNKSDSSIALLYELNESKLVSGFRAIGGDLLGGPLTDMSVYGSKVEFTDELSCISKLVLQISSLRKNDLSEYSDMEAEIMCDISDNVKNSRILSVVGGELVYCMNSSWENGESFFGISKPENFGNFQPLFESFTEFLVADAHTPELFIEDFSTVTEFFAVMAEEGLFSSFSDLESMVTKLGGGDTVYRLLNVLAKNPRAEHISSELITVYMSYISDHITSAPLESEYARFVSEVALILINSSGLPQSERVNAVNDGLYFAFQNAGMTVSDEALDRYTEELIAAYDENGAGDPEKLVKEFFELYISASDGDVEEGASSELS